LRVGSILRAVNSVLAIQPDVGEKPIVESVQVVALRFFDFPMQALVQN
jgi:hypothetical protein